MEATLKHIVDSSLQWIFVGGKGGVGKTTTSCGLATLLASTALTDPNTGVSRPRRVLLISTDPAHNLSDAFKQQFSSTPTPVKGMEATLSAMEIDPQSFTHGEFLRQFQKEAVKSAGGSLSEQVSASFGAIGAVLKEAASSLPGIDEVSVFAEILQGAQQLTFDVIIFDTAPTGHTLRMLSLPQTLNSAVDKLMELKEVAPLLEAASTFFGGSNLGGSLHSSGNGGGGVTDRRPSSHPPPSSPSSAGASGGEGGLSMETIATTLGQWREAIREVQAQFNDPQRTAFICVCIAEFLSVYETERLVQELMKYNIGCDSIVVNQLVLRPRAEPPCRMCAARQKVQQKYLDQIDLLYEDFHVVRLPLLSDEVRGVPALQKFANLLIEPYDADRDGYLDLAEIC